MSDEEKHKKKEIKVDVLTNFIKGAVESFSDAEVYTDHDGSAEDGSLDFAKMRVWLATEY